ncbi:MAG TPA: GNAT family N-acetyltransferase [Solirubrobacteraceae bacterium]|nr:GNAT family N-acetyltransferase [Solirubrobacteraceae bacterium]
MEPDPVRLRSGREIAIRPIRADDAGRLEASHALLSPGTRYRRFLAAKPRLTEPELRYLTEVDGRDHVALIATPIGDPERIVGVGRFIRDHGDPKAAEFAIVVSDAYQGDGLGTELITRLAGAATERGISRFTATVLADNEPIHRLLRRLAGEFAEHRRAGSVEELTVDLAA